VTILRSDHLTPTLTLSP